MSARMWYAVDKQTSARKNPRIPLIGLTGGRGATTLRRMVLFLVSMHRYNMAQGAQGRHYALIAVSLVLIRDE